MMETKNTEEKKFLSTDLRGYQKYLEGLLFTDRHIEFLQLAPRKLFMLFGSYACVNFLKQEDFRSKFLKLIRPEYQPGTLKKYASGITHFRNYLITTSALKAVSIGLKRKHEIGPVRAYYRENKNTYFEEVEKRYFEYLELEREYSLNDFEKKIVSYEKLASFIIGKGLTTFEEVTAQELIEFRNQETTYQTNWVHLRVFLSFCY